MCNEMYMYFLCLVSKNFIAAQTACASNINTVFNLWLSYNLELACILKSVHIHNDL